MEAKGEGRARRRPQQPRARRTHGPAPPPRGARETHSAGRAGRAPAGGPHRAVGSRRVSMNLRVPPALPAAGAGAALCTGGVEGPGPATPATSLLALEVKEGSSSKSEGGTEEEGRVGDHGSVQSGTIQKAGSPALQHLRKVVYGHPRKGPSSRRGNHPEKVPEGQEALGHGQNSHNSRPWSLR